MPEWRAFPDEQPSAISFRAIAFADCGYPRTPGNADLSAAGIVAVGGTGNFARLPAGKQIALPKDILCVFAAAGTTEDGTKAQSSSEGPCTWSGVKFYDDFPADQTGCQRPFHRLSDVGPPQCAGQKVASRIARKPARA